MVGAGNIRLEDGRSEGLAQGLLFARSGGASMGWRSASASNKIELRATLNSTGSIAGNWEERTFNVTGSASGQASGNTIRPAIDAGVVAGQMSVVTNGASQTISVRTDGAPQGREYQSAPRLKPGAAAQAEVRR